MRGEKDLVIVDDEDEPSGMARWAPAAVVITVVGGFIALAWYAYHAGMQSVKDEDLLVVEADRTPVKEKPANPGGMQFPNQDKTIFDTFSGGEQKPAKVERVLPVPEEPMSKETSKDTDSSDTSTWINDKLHKSGDDNKKSADREQVIGKDNKKTAPFSPPHVSQDNPDHQVIAAKGEDDDQSETYVAHKHADQPAKALDKAVKSTDKDKVKDAKAEEDKKAAAEAQQQKADKAKEEADAKAKAKEEADAKATAAKEEKAKHDADTKAEKAKEEADAKAEKAKEEKKQAAPAKASAAMVQLGAYRSEDEARAAWDKMHIKQKELSDKNPVIVKADLGEKGIYYRLRVGLSSTAEAKSLCSALSAKGQACIIPTGQ